MSILERPGASINYEVWGDGGIWTTLVNGHNRPLNDFRMFGRYLVTHGCRVLAMDNRGSGQTKVQRPFTFDEMVADVKALWDELGITRTGLLGVSMGGFIAQGMTLSFPGNVARLVLVSTASGPKGIRPEDRPWTADVREVQAKLAPYFTAEFAERNRALVQSMAKQIAKAVAQGSFAKMSDWQRRAISGVDFASRLGEIKVPTLVMHGDCDQIIPLAAGEKLAREISGAKLEILKGAGHLLLAEKPRELYQIAGEILTQNPTRSPSA